MKKILSSLIIVLLLTLPMSLADVGDACVDNTECGADESCLGDTCVILCVDDSVCATDEECQNNVCTTIDTADDSDDTQTIDLTEVCSLWGLTVGDGDTFDYCGESFTVGEILDNGMTLNDELLAESESKLFSQRILIKLEQMDLDSEDNVIGAQLKLQLKRQITQLPFSENQFKIFYEATNADGTTEMLPLGSVSADADLLAQIDYDEGTAYLKIRSATPEKLTVGIDLESDGILESISLLWPIRQTIIGQLLNALIADTPSQYQFDETAQDTTFTIGTAEYTFELDEIFGEKAIRFESDEEFTALPQTNPEDTKIIWITTKLADADATDTACRYSQQDASLDDFQTKTAVQGYYPLGQDKIYDIFTDYCKDENTLVNYGCVGLVNAQNTETWGSTSRVTFLEINCPCAEGKCDTGPFCVDTDRNTPAPAEVSGKVMIFTPGTAAGNQELTPGLTVESGISKSVKEEFTDTCTGNDLTEYSCDVTGKIETTITCPEQCVDGACVGTSATPDCTDDTGCVAPKTCVSGTCVTGSDVCDPTCGAGESCVSGSCEADVSTCLEDTECGTDEICSNSDGDRVKTLSAGETKDVNGIPVKLESITGTTADIKLGSQALTLSLDPTEEKDILEELWTFSISNDFLIISPQGSQCKAPVTCADNTECSSGEVCSAEGSCVFVDKCYDTLDDGTIISVGGPECESEVPVPCDSDGICDVADGENTFTCPADCLTDACGDGVEDAGELCDSTAPRISYTCLDLGFDDGIVSCTATCTLDNSDCTISEPDCTNDGDCIDGTCSPEGTCVGESACTVETADIDCAADELCNCGDCVTAPTCETFVNCQGGYSCSSRGLCVEGQACEDASGCQEGEVCAHGICMLPESVDDWCTVETPEACDPACGTDETCVEGACEVTDDNTCTTNDECRTDQGETCVQEECVQSGGLHYGNLAALQLELGELNAMLMDLDKAFNAPVDIFLDPNAGINIGGNNNERDTGVLTYLTDFAERFAGAEIFFGLFDEKGIELTGPWGEIGQGLEDLGKIAELSGDITLGLEEFDALGDLVGLNPYDDIGAFAALGELGIKSGTLINLARDASIIAESITNPDLRNSALIEAGRIMSLASTSIQGVQTGLDIANSIQRTVEMDNAAFNAGLDAATEFNQAFANAEALSGSNTLEDLNSIRDSIMVMNDARDLINGLTIQNPELVSKLAVKTGSLASNLDSAQTFQVHVRDNYQLALADLNFGSDFDNAMLSISTGLLDSQIGSLDGFANIGAIEELNNMLGTINVGLNSAFAALDAAELIANQISDEGQRKLALGEVNELRASFNVLKEGEGFNSVSLNSIAKIANDADLAAQGRFNDLEKIVDSNQELIAAAYGQAGNAELSGDALIMARNAENAVQMALTEMGEITFNNPELTSDFGSQFSTIKSSHASFGSMIDEISIISRDFDAQQAADFAAAGAADDLAGAGVLIGSSGVTFDSNQGVLSGIFGETFVRSSTDTWGTDFGSDFSINNNMVGDSPIGSIADKFNTGNTFEG